MLIVSGEEQIGYIQIIRPVFFNYKQEIKRVYLRPRTAKKINNGKTINGCN
jgi:hypothetical protein